MALQSAFNFKQWIEEHRYLLKPPVGNQQVFKDNKDFIVMVVGGPNSRKDYHINNGEEFFFQLEGDIILKVIDEGEFKDIHIKEGDIFLLPPNVPHSPRRGPNTVGLVMERYRSQEEMDGFQWYCENCNSKLYEEFIPVSDIVGQLPVVMNAFWASDEKRTCNNCGEVLAKPVIS